MQLPAGWRYQRGRAAPRGRDTAVGAATSARSAPRSSHADIDAATTVEAQLEQSILATRYFAGPLHAPMLDQHQTNVEAARFSEGLLHGAALDAASGAGTGWNGGGETPPAFRSQGFRRAVVTAYEHRCAFCLLRVVTPDAHTAVEAAHIIPWSEAHRDDLPNGLALCRTCHWAFDEGLATVTDRGAVKVSKRASTPPNSAGYLASRDGAALCVPAAGEHRPDPEALAWHRRKVFRRV